MKRKLTTRQMIKCEKVVEKVKKKYEKNTKEKIGNINDFNWDKVINFYGGNIIIDDIFTYSECNKIIIKTGDKTFDLIIDIRYYEALNNEGLAKYNEFLIRSLFQVLYDNNNFMQTKIGEIYIKEFDKLVDCYSILEIPYKKFEVTEKTKKFIKDHPELHLRCPVRQRMGLFYTDEEKKEYIEKSLKRKLP